MWGSDGGDPCYLGASTTAHRGQERNHLRLTLWGVGADTLILHLDLPSWSLVYGSSLSAMRRHEDKRAACSPSSSPDELDSGRATLT